MTAAHRTARRRMSVDERREEIITTAANLFDRAGYSNTSMEDIARSLGIAKPTLYHYFRSKDEILSSIHGEFIDLLIGRHDQRRSAGLGPAQMLLEVMADVLDLMQTHRGHVRVFFEHHRELPPDTRESVRGKRDQYQAMVTEILEAGVADGVFRDIDVKLATLAVFGMCNWAYQWYRPQAGARTRDIAYTFWGYIVHGIGSDKVRQEWVDSRS